MHFRRAIGGEGDAPGQFNVPIGVTVARGLLVVSEYETKRLQVLTLTGVPLQTMTFPESLFGLCADEERVWVCGGSQALHELLMP